MLPSDGKIITCVQRNLLSISHRIVHVPRETLSGLLHIRGIVDVITAWQQGVWSIMADIQNKSKQYKCWKFWQEDKMYCVMKGLQNFKHTSYTFYDQQQLQD